MHHLLFIIFVFIVQSFSRVWFFVTPWTIQCLEYIGGLYVQLQRKRILKDINNIRNILLEILSMRWDLRQMFNYLFCCCLVTKNHVWFFGAPMNCSPPDSSVRCISQAWILESFAISFSKGITCLSIRKWNLLCVKFKI